MAVGGQGSASLEPYLAAWHRLVAAWRTAGAEGTAADAVLDAALAHGLDLTGPTPAVPEATEPGEAARCAAALLRRSGEFDAAGYLQANPHLWAAGVDPVEHFAHGSWQGPLNPSLDFDVWWYQCEYLDPADDRVDPFVHYLLVGRRLGHLPLPTRPPRPAPTSYAGRRPRRVCLFAGWDPDGLVDDTVVDYVRELARHADVYYLADCAMEDGELDRLAGLVQGAWAVRHGAYDFGSYSLLARELVGWDVIAGYDELLLVNDSCYLVRSLDATFAAMDARACHWWGMQLTSRHFTGVVDRPGGPRRPQPAADVRRVALPRAVYAYDDFVHVGSYFLALRADVIADAGFRRRLDGAVAQRHKSHLIRRYETGTTQYLVGQGYTFSTLVEDLWPYHPVYGPGALELVAGGFPLLKRQLLAGNPFAVPDLRRWPERLRAAAPEAPVAGIRRHLRRVSDDDRRQHGLGITTGPDGAVVRPRRPVPDQLHRRDRRTPKRDDWWVFPVSPDRHRLEGDARALFEEVRDDPSLTKIVLTRSRPVEASGENVVVARLATPAGLGWVCGARPVLVGTAPRVALPYPLAWRRHTFVDTATGDPLDGAGPTDAGPGTDLGAGPDGVRRPADRPRHDLLLRAAERLPADLVAQERRLRQAADGRRVLLVVLTPATATALALPPDGAARLARRCRGDDVVLAVREATAEPLVTARLGLAGGSLVVSGHRYPDPEMLLRAADAVVTDDAATAVAALAAARPVLTAATDEATARRLESLGALGVRGVRTADDLLATLPDLLAPNPEDVAAWARARAALFDHADGRAAWRVAQRVRALATPTA